MEVGDRVRIKSFDRIMYLEFTDGPGVMIDGREHNWFDLIGRAGHIEVIGGKGEDQKFALAFYEGAPRARCGSAAWFTKEQLELAPWI